MKFIITDLSNLFSHQNILQYQIADHKFLVPGSMYINFMKFGATLKDKSRLDAFASNIATAQNNGLLDELNIPDIDNVNNDALINCSIEFSKTNEGKEGQVFIYPVLPNSLTAGQRKVVEENGISLYSSNDLNQLYYQQKIIQKKSDQVSTDNKGLTNNLIIATVTTLFLIVAAIYLPRLFSVLPAWLWAPIFILASIGLFWIRGNCRLVYGVMEFVVGAIAVVYGFTKNQTGFVSFFLAILSGEYVMVRGIDNVFKSISDTKLGRKMNNLRFKQ